jgi:hypothetical protein
MQLLLMEDGTVVLGECTNTQRWIKARRIPRRLFLWACTQTKMAIYVTSQHLRFGGGETDPLVEFRNAKSLKLYYLSNFQLKEIIKLIKVSRSFTLTHRDLQYSINQKIYMKNQLFLNIYNKLKLVTYN